MKEIIKDKKILKIAKVIEWIMYMTGYTLVFILVSKIFNSITVFSPHKYLMSILIVFVIYILNKTIKPILITLTIPITGLTLGLFYPFINLFILKLTDWIFGKHFEIDNVYLALLAAILISIMNFIVEEIIKKIIKRLQKHE